VAPDTLSSSERTYRQATLSSPGFRGAQTAFTVQALRANPQIQPGFAVTPALRNAYYNALVNADITLDRAVFDGALRWIDQEIGYELTYSKWGEQTARQRLNAEDVQVRTAVELLSRATSPQSLFTLAENFDATRSAAR
jgi:hypothetical protein